MDSNTIGFALTLSSSLHLNSPTLPHQSKSLHSKPNDDSTNFVDFQQFNKASISSCETLDNVHQSGSHACQIPKKTKIIHKQNFPKKHSQNHLQKQFDHKFTLIRSKTASNQNPHVYNDHNLKSSGGKPSQTNPSGSKSHSFASIFDWMMQIASIMKLSRSVFYRACSIFYESCKRDSKVLENSNVEKYVCACLSISAKLETSNIDFAQGLVHINNKRIPKQAISDAQAGIYIILEWKLPLISLISQQVHEIFQKWDAFLAHCQKDGLIRKQTKERLTLAFSNSQQQNAKQKIQGEIMYLLDIMLLNQAKKYLNSQSLSSNSSIFVTPITIALYTVLASHFGEPQRKQQFFFPVIKKFYRDGLGMPTTQVDRLGKEIQLSFMIFEFEQHLSRIPLDKNWKHVMDKDILLYLPINVLKKTGK